MGLLHSQTRVGVRLKWSPKNPSKIDKWPFERMPISDRLEGLVLFPFEYKIGYIHWHKLMKSETYRHGLPIDDQDFME